MPFKIVFYHSPTCSHCREVEPIIAKAARKEALPIEKIDVDTLTEIPEGLEGVPTLCIQNEKNGVTSCMPEIIDEMSIRKFIRQFVTQEKVKLLSIEE